MIFKSLEKPSEDRLMKLDPAMRQHVLAQFDLATHINATLNASMPDFRVAADALLSVYLDAVDQVSGEQEAANHLMMLSMVAAEMAANKRRAAGGQPTTPGMPDLSLMPSPARTQ